MFVKYSTRRTKTWHSQPRCAPSGSQRILQDPAWFEACTMQPSRAPGGFCFSSLCFPQRPATILPPTSGPVSLPFWVFIPGAFENRAHWVPWQMLAERKKTISCAADVNATSVRRKTCTMPGLAEGGHCPATLPVTPPSDGRLQRAEWGLCGTFCQPGFPGHHLDTCS